MGGLYSITTRAPGTVLTAAIYNADHQNHVDGQTPALTDDHSAGTTQMKTQTDPGEVGSESLPNHLGGELERLRFALAELKGKDYWYETAPVPGTSDGLIRVHDGHWIVEARYMDVTDYGAVGDGLTDDSAAIQDAIDAAYATWATSLPFVYFPRGRYKLGTSLDLSNKRGIRLVSEPGIDGRGTAQLLGYTGAGKPMIDMCGAHGAILEGFYLASTTSTLGIIMGYTNADDACLIRLRNLQILMQSDKSANSNLGTVGIFNKSAENNSLENVIIEANMPLILTSQGTTSAAVNWIRGSYQTAAAAWRLGDASGFTLTSEYATLANMSCGVHNWHNVMLRAVGKHRPALAVFGGAHIDARAVYLCAPEAASDNGTYRVGAQFHHTRGTNMTSAQAEDVETAIEGSTLTDTTLDLATDDSTSAHAPVVRLYGAGDLAQVQVRASVWDPDDARLLVDTDSNDPFTGFMQNTRFGSNSTVAGKARPFNGVVPRLHSAEFVSAADDFRVDRQIMRTSGYKSLGAIPSGGLIDYTELFRIVNVTSGNRRVEGNLRVVLHLLVETSTRIELLSYTGQTEVSWYQLEAGGYGISSVSALHDGQKAAPGAVLDVSTVTPTFTQAGDDLVFKVAIQFTGTNMTDFTMACTYDIAMGLGGMTGSNGPIITVS